MKAEDFKKKVKKLLQLADNNGVMGNICEDGRAILSEVAKEVDFEYRMHDEIDTQIDISVHGSLLPNLPLRELVVKSIVIGASGDEKSNVTLTTVDFTSNGISEY